MNLTELLILMIPILMDQENVMHDPNLSGDDGKALGILQIHQCVLDDVNEFIKMPNFYKPANRESRANSMELFLLYQLRWNKQFENDFMTDENRCEIIARIWNGGPDGWQKDSTYSYWKAIEGTVKRSLSIANALEHARHMLQDLKEQGCIK